jgi:holliday junction DNA helicase RuvB
VIVLRNSVAVYFHTTLATPPSTPMNSPKDLSAAEPDSIYQMIGQTQVRNQVITAVDASQQDGRLFESPTLMVGPGGCGKSQTARCIANMVAASDFNTVLAQSLKTPGDLSACLLEQKAGSILFLDEASGLSDAAQLALYLAIDQRKVFVPTKGSSPVALDIEPFVLLLATTHEFTLNDSMRQRCRLILRFTHYSAQELEQIAKHRAAALDWSVDPDVFIEAAKRGRGTPRLVLRLLNSSQRSARAEASSTISMHHFRKTCVLESIDREGLDSTEQRYLQILLNGPHRLNMLAAKLALPTRTVERVIESDYLIRSGLIEKDETSRRVLTTEGRRHAKLLAKGEGYE